MQKIKKSVRGLTLIEVLIGMFVFTTIIVATSGIFNSSLKSKTVTQDSQKKYDLAFSAISDVGKLLSTSTVLNVGGSGTTINAYSYSLKKCVRFIFTNNTLRMEEKGFANDQLYSAKCNDPYMSASTPGYPKSTRTVVDSYITGQFALRTLDNKQTTSQANKHSGMVTIFARVYNENPSTVGAKFVPIQTTIALRDYLD